jgi:hypothetical protein
LTPQKNNNKTVVCCGVKKKNNDEDNNNHTCTRLPLGDVIERLRNVLAGSGKIRVRSDGRLVSSAKNVIQLLER